MMAKYVPLKGTQYVDLPPKVKNLKAVINIKNDDDKCFLWSVLAHLYEANDHRSRVNYYKQYESELNMNGIVYPVAAKDVPKFEKQNNISVNVFRYGDRYYLCTFPEVNKKNMLTFYSEKKVVKHTTVSSQISIKCYTLKQTISIKHFTAYTVYMDL